MRRPKKQKVEVVELVPEDGAEVGSDLVATAEQQLSRDAADVEPSAAASSECPSRALHLGKRWQAAMEAWVKASIEAEAMREVATEAEAKLKLAERLIDAKEQRLLAGDKRAGRRKDHGFGAARRSYNLVIDRALAQLECEMKQRMAAERERDAARAEIRMMKLE